MSHRFLSLITWTHQCNEVDLTMDTSLFLFQPVFSTIEPSYFGSLNFEEYLMNDLSESVVLQPPPVLIGYNLFGVKPSRTYSKYNRKAKQEGRESERTDQGAKECPSCQLMKLPCS